MVLTHLLHRCDCERAPSLRDCALAPVFGGRIEGAVLVRRGALLRRGADVARQQRAKVVEARRRRWRVPERAVVVTAT